MTLGVTSEKYGCQHEPKVVRKLGLISGSKAEILVCKNCKNDPLLDDFLEVTIE